LLFILFTVYVFLFADFVSRLIDIVGMVAEQTLNVPPPGHGGGDARAIFPDKVRDCVNCLFSIPRIAGDGLRGLSGPLRHSGFQTAGITMSNSTVDLDALVEECLSTLNDPPGPEAPPPDTTMRERFFELLVLILGNLYGKTPVASSLFERSTLSRVTAGMDDMESGKLSLRTEDWMRLEGLLRQQDGQKAYFLTRPSLAVLSSLTVAGTLGEVFAGFLGRYAQSPPSENIRSATRKLGSYFLMRAARS
jgi:hypothetical protein